MAKSLRQLEERIKTIEIVINVIDARIPNSSTNPDLLALIGKSFLIKYAAHADLINNKFHSSLVKSNFILGGMPDSRKKLLAEINKISASLKDKYLKKGIDNWATRIIVIGIPNTGKSTLINMLCQSKRAKAMDKPGTTKNEQWIKLSDNILISDFPGIMVKKIENESEVYKLFLTNCLAQNDNIDETAAVKFLFDFLEKNTNHKSPESDSENSFFQWLEKIGGKYGMLVKGSKLDYPRVEKFIVSRYRSGELTDEPLEQING